MDLDKFYFNNLLQGSFFCPSSFRQFNLLCIKESEKRKWTEKKLSVELSAEVTDKLCGTTKIYFLLIIGNINPCNIYKKISLTIYNIYFLCGRKLVQVS